MKANDDEDLDYTDDDDDDESYRPRRRLDPADVILTILKVLGITALVVVGLVIALFAVCIAILSTAG
ncbi:MAG: hypothetical protein R3C18_25185 [Planctomycetaceae bacterium]